MVNSISEELGEKILFASKIMVNILAESLMHARVEISTRNATLGHVSSPR